MTVRVTQPPIDIPGARRQRAREQAATFTPTAKWQDVPDDAILPPGLQIQIDMETGRKRARLAPEPAAQPTNIPEAKAADGPAEAKPNGAALPESMIAAFAVKPRRTNWMWFPRIPAGMISILGAKGGSCKGLTCASLAAAVTTGGMWPDRTGPARKGAVLWCESEDPLPEVVVPRLIAAGADLSRITFASRNAFAAEQNLRAYIQRTDTKLIVMSPMVSFLQLNDITVELGVREVLERSQASIDGIDCALIGIAHSNKKADLAAIERILGAVAFTNFVRSVLLTTVENRDEGTYRLCHGKHNLSTPADDLILHPIYVGDDPGHRDQFVKLDWSEPENGNVDPAGVFDRRQADARQPSARDWLRTYLREHGESLRDDVVVAGAQAGFKEIALERAIMRDHRLQSRRERFPNQAWWSAV